MATLNYPALWPLAMQQLDTRMCRANTVVAGVNTVWLSHTDIQVQTDNTLQAQTQCKQWSTDEHC